MTTPEERTRAVVDTREFLDCLTCPVRTPGIPHEIRDQARRLLRHYPFATDMELAAFALPQWFGIAS
ncbi:BPSL0761 family protein [Noviherbaspirillum aerium]|uniref:BPSL0761 family protein n=1 Tax=Noviherbaspirillum aerium TaxID=2588497 RepID=UPI00124D00AD|nr:BPSL0761 family protein [Noviherbaspirillum aerium]